MSPGSRAQTGFPAWSRHPRRSHAVVAARIRAAPRGNGRRRSEQQQRGAEQDEKAREQHRGDVDGEGACRKVGSGGIPGTAPGTPERGVCTNGRHRGSSCVRYVLRIQNRATPLQGPRWPRGLPLKPTRCVCARVRQMPRHRA